jgi:uncharacterized protein YcbK (DUF882 family)
MSITRISDHFTWSEAACHDGADVPLEHQPNARRLALTVLEPLRARLGGPLVPISWYRSAWYNASVGGAKASQHLTASAADIRPASIEDLPRLKACLEEMIHEMVLPELGGWGWYPGRWIHVDVRPRAGGHIAHWVGNAVGAEEP